MIWTTEHCYHHHCHRHGLVSVMMMMMLWSTLHKWSIGCEMRCEMWEIAPHSAAAVDQQQLYSTIVSKRTVAAHDNWLLVRMVSVMLDVEIGCFDVGKCHSWADSMVLRAIWVVVMVWTGGGEVMLIGGERMVMMTMMMCRQWPCSVRWGNQGDWYRLRSQGDPPHERTCCL